MEKIQELQGKKIAIVGLGKSWFDFALARSNGEQFDEVWVINAVANVIKHDRVFMLDPASRFLDSDDAGLQTNGMKEVLLNHEGPIYTCELDDRCPGLVEYPIEQIVEENNSYYLSSSLPNKYSSLLFLKLNDLLVSISFESCKHHSLKLSSGPPMSFKRNTL